MARAILISVWLVAGSITTGAAGQKQTGPVDVDELLRQDLPQNRSEAYFNFALGRLYERQGDLERAIEHLRRAVNSDKNSSELRSEYAAILYGAGRVQEAVAQCRKAIELDRDNLDAHLLLGSIYAGMRGSEKLLKQAIAEFKEVLRIDKNDFRASYSLAKLYSTSGDYDNAIRYFQEFIRQRPDSDIGYQELAELYLEKGKTEEAIASLKQALERNPRSQRAIRRLKELFQKSNNPEGLLEVYRKIVQSDPENLEARRELAKQLIELQQYEEAAVHLEAAVNSDPADYDASVQLGRVYLYLRKPQQALDILKEAQKNNPTALEVKFWLGLAHEELGDTDAAVAELESLLEATRREGGNYNQGERENRMLILRQVGIIYLRTGDTAKAVNAFTRLREISNSPRDLELLIDAYRSDGQHDRAYALSRDAMEKFPGDKFLRFQHARLLARRDLQAAVSMMQKSISSDPKDVEAYLSLSQIYLDAKEYAQAEGVLHRAEAIPDLTSGLREMVRFQLGAVYERSKNYDKAEEVFREILQLNPKNHGALNYLGYMFADRGVKLQEALDLIKRAVELEPNNGAYLDSLGWAYFKLDNLTLAEENLVKAVNRLKNDPTIHEHLGDLYFRLEKYTKAEEAWRRALDHAVEEEEINRIKEKIEKLKRVAKSSRLLF